MTTSPDPTWLTPQQLADELGRTHDWVRIHMASGDIPCVKVGRYRYFTPECRARLVEQQLAASAPPEPTREELAARAWSRPARTGRRRSA